ncbi:MAG: 4Fe-4S binding protein [Pseudomonadota bacterium]
MGYILKFASRTLCLLFSRKDVTEMYPDPVAKPMLPKRARGFLSLDTYKCTLCGKCVKICPSSAININRNNLSLKVNYINCMFCGYCVNACPYGALVFSKEFEGATMNSEAFIHEFNIINVDNISKEIL